ncbi:MAG: hypothetical protein ACHQ01_08275 [Candidatus Limnocylindrales bacterium]
MKGADQLRPFPAPPDPEVGDGAAEPDCDAVAAADSSATFRVAAGLDGVADWLAEADVQANALSATRRTTAK